MSSFILPVAFPRVKRVHSFDELVSTPFADGVNALCWQRSLGGDFGEVIQLLGNGTGIRIIEDSQLTSLPASVGGQTAIKILLQDQNLLRQHGVDPALNCIYGYPRDEPSGPLSTDVFSFHADSAPVETDTYLCTYHGSPSEGLDNDEAVRKVEVPAIRAALLRQYGGADDANFRGYLSERCYDLHYAPLPSAHPFSFGVGNLWRIATQWPESLVPPCIHRAPATLPGQPRLLLIS